MMFWWVSSFIPSEIGQVFVQTKTEISKKKERKKTLKLNEWTSCMLLSFMSFNINFGLKFFYNGKHITYLQRKGLQLYTNNNNNNNKNKNNKNLKSFIIKYIV